MSIYRRVIISVVAGWVLAGDSAVYAGNRRLAEERNHGLQAKLLFETESGKEATIENVVAAMTQPSSSAASASIAVDAYAAQYSSEPEFVHTVERCLTRFGASDLVAYKCARALKSSAPERSAGLWKSIVDNPNAEPLLRMLSARELLVRNDFSGSVTVASGLVSDDPNDRRRAVELLNAYIARDGEKAAGRRFNAKALLDEAQPHLDSPTAAELRSKLERKRRKQ